MKSSFGKIVVPSLFLLLVACGGGGSGADNTAAPLAVPQPPPATGTVGDGRLDRLAEWARASQGVPAMAVVLVSNGQIAEMAAVGRRSVTDNVNVTVGDKWHLGSLTKAMTSTLAGVLVEQSLITWDTTPLDVWPELDGTIDSGFRNITLLELLSHTAGLRAVNSVPTSYEQRAAGTAMEKRRAFAGDLLAERPAGPEGLFSYSNGGYIVAGAMMESLMSTPWEQLLREQVFAPLGMSESGFGAPGSPAVVDQPWGHWDSGNRFDAVSPGPDADNPDVLGPAGTVHATLDDYAQFMLAHIAGARGIPGLLTVPVYDVLHTAVDDGSGPGWGIIAFQDWAEGPVFAHAGSNQRWYAVVRLAPELDAGVLVVVNAGGDRANAAIDSIGDLLLERFQASR